MWKLQDEQSVAGSTQANETFTYFYRKHHWALLVLINIPLLLCRISFSSWTLRSDVEEKKPPGSVVRSSGRLLCMSSPGSSESPSLSASCHQSCRRPFFETYHLGNYEMNVDVLEPIKSGTLSLTRTVDFSRRVFRKVLQNIKQELFFSDYDAVR